jgi:thiol-disulfide isomerase/thioredoxin
MTLASAAIAAIALIAWPGSDAGTAQARPDASANTPILLHFHAEWCGPCKQMAPIVARLKAKGYPIRSFDIDQNKPLAGKYRVTGVPAFIVVDAQGRELSRSAGAQPASELASLYNDAVHDLVAARSDGAMEVSPADLRPQSPSRRLAAADEAAAEADPLASADDQGHAPVRGPRAPLPWETAVRIKVGDRSRGGPIGFGSGTIIRSTESETIILTCAHIFHVEGVRADRQPTPKQFRIPIEVDLFDGQLHGPQARPYLHPVESVAGEAIDYDFKSDVGLIRIRPGRALAASPVVPATWRPSPGVKMTTVGCSEGQDASPWSTRITNPAFRGQIDGRDYSAIECEFAPKQGRSGGGLYTLDGYVAGVCNFAEPRGGHGLYALPASIHQLLDRNDLAVCYNPPAGDGRMIASRSGESATPAGRRGGATTVRAQNGDLASAIPTPRPEQVGVELLPIEERESSSAGATRSANRPAADDDDDDAESAPSVGSWRAAAGVSARRISAREAIAAIDEEAESAATDHDDNGLLMEPAPSPRGRTQKIQPIEDR